MKASQFTYTRADSVEHAVSLLATEGDGAKLIAGGGSLIPLLRYRLANVERLIDIGRLDEIAGIQVSGGCLTIGGVTRQAAIEDSGLVREHLPVLAETMPLVAHRPIRNRGTIGGSIAHADPAAELPAVVLALDATVEAVSVRGSRRVSAQELFVSYYTTELADDELLTSVSLPLATIPEGTAIMEVSRRPGDFAIAGIVARLAGRDERCGTARLVAFGVGERPARIEAAEQRLVGTSLSDDDLAAAAGLVSDALEPRSDAHASADYRRHATVVLARRALARARHRLIAIAGTKGDSQ
jgi:CO/xanthine dehydrogenase FAD-binding subunit